MHKQYTTMPWAVALNNGHYHRDPNTRAEFKALLQAHEDLEASFGTDNPMVTTAWLKVLVFLRDVALTNGPSHHLVAQEIKRLEELTAVLGTPNPTPQGGN